MRALVEYLFTDDFQNKLETFLGWVLPFFGAVIIARLVKFVLEICF